jgi:hypothetical protein
MPLFVSAERNQGGRQQPREMILVEAEPKVTASLSQGRRCTEGENEISGDGCFKNYACHEPKSPLCQIRNGRQLPMAAADHCLCGAQSHC